MQSGGTARVYWNVANVSACTITGSNGDSWDGLFSGAPGETTAPIIEQTTYTLHCDAFQGATPASIDETQTVDVLPSYREI